MHPVISQTNDAPLPNSGPKTGVSGAHGEPIEPYRYSENARYRATSGDAQGFGETPRDALEALLPHLAAQATLPIVIWPYNQGDRFFSDAQQARLQELTNRRDELTPKEHQELMQLAEATIEAAIARTESLTPTKP